jgi:hypothetical protein
MTRKKYRKHHKRKAGGIPPSSPKHLGFVMTEVRSPLRHATPEQQTTARLQFGESVNKEHSRLLNRLQELIRQCNPLQMLAHFAFYDRALFEIQQGGNYQPLHQHAVEFFHAVFLTIPVTELKVRATPPEVILELNDVLRGLTMTFPMLGIRDGVKDNEQAKHARSLAQMIRMHTHAVRNAGYYQQVMRQLKDVFIQLEEPYFDPSPFPSSTAKSPSTMALSSVPAKAAQVLTPMSLSMLNSCILPCARC